MKPNCRTFASLVILHSLVAIASGDPAPQPQVDFTAGSQGTFNTDWEGVAGRTYFMQFSLDLVNWYYAPSIDFGDGEHSRGVESDAPRFFVRLDYGEFDGITSLDAAMAADFDADGLSNIFEVTYGSDPFEADPSPGGASPDPDEDGLGYLSEQSKKTDPTVKDNPLLNLQVVSE